MDSRSWFLGFGILEFGVLILDSGFGYDWFKSNNEKNTVCQRLFQVLGKQDVYEPNFANFFGDFPP